MLNWLDFSVYELDEQESENLRSKNSNLIFIRDINKDEQPGTLSFTANVIYDKEKKDYEDTFIENGIEMLTLPPVQYLRYAWA